MLPATAFTPTPTASTALPSALPPEAAAVALDERPRLIWRLVVIEEGGRRCIVRSDGRPLRIAADLYPPARRAPSDARQTAHQTASHAPAGQRPRRQRRPRQPRATPDTTNLPAWAAEAAAQYRQQAQPSRPRRHVPVPPPLPAHEYYGSTLTAQAAALGLSQRDLAARSGIKRGVLQYVLSHDDEWRMGARVVIHGTLARLQRVYVASHTPQEPRA